MLEIHEQWNEQNEIGDGNPIELSLEKWEKIRGVLGQLHKIIGVQTCALCYTHMGCTDCPLVWCGKDSIFDQVDISLHHTTSAVEEMILQLEKIRAEDISL